MTTFASRMQDFRRRPARPGQAYPPSGIDRRLPGRDGDGGFGGSIYDVL